MRSRAPKAYVRGGSGCSPSRLRLCISAGRGTPAMASVVAARSIRLTTWPLTPPGVILRRGREMLGPADDQRHVQPRIVAPVNAAGLQPAVVGKEDDDRVVFQSVGPQPVEHPADAAVHAGDRVEVAGPFLPHDGVVGIVRRRCDILRRGNFGVLASRRPTPRGPCRRSGDRKCRIPPRASSRRQKTAASLSKRLPVVRLVDRAFIDEVQIELAGAHVAVANGLDVGREVARVAQASG